MRQSRRKHYKLARWLTSKIPWGPRVVIMRLSQHMHIMRRVLLTYSYFTIYIPLQSQTFGVDLFTPFHSMVQLNTLLWIWRVSKTLWTLYQNISLTNRLMVKKLMILRISMAWAMPFGILSYWYTRLNGMPSIWIITLTLLEQKYLLNSLWELCLTRTTTRRKLQNWSPSPLRKSLLLLHSQLNPRTRSTQSRNISKVTRSWQTLQSWPSHTLKLQNN